MRSPRAGLSTEIEYSQPVLYKHFSGMDAIAEAVAVDGFGELTDALRTARTGAATPEDGFRRIAHAYVDFARDNPALYDAMFTRATTLHFAADDTPARCRRPSPGYVRRSQRSQRGPDVDTTTEVVWAALHGLATLSRSGRLRPEQEFERIEVLADQFTRTVR